MISIKRWRKPLLLAKAGFELSIHGLGSQYWVSQAITVKLKNSKQLVCTKGNKSIYIQVCIRNIPVDID